METLQKPLPAYRPEQTEAPGMGLLDSVRSRGDGPNLTPPVQPPYAENRTYGGVGALTGAISSGRPDPVHASVWSEETARVSRAWLRLAGRQQSLVSENVRFSIHRNQG